MTIEWKSGGTGFVDAGGKRLEIRMHGPSPSEATTIVLLHEGLGSAELWRDFPAKLAEATGLGVFAYSREGYGNSDPVTLPRPLDYMERHAIEVMPGILNALSPRRVILLGHSDGASIAALYLGNFQDPRVRGLVLLAPHFFTEDGGLAAIAAAKQMYETGDLRTRLAKYHRDVDNAFRGWNDAWLNPEFKNWNIEECIDYVRVPVLAIQGKQDQYGTSAQLDALESRLYSPFEAVLLDDCRHSPFIDQPVETVRAFADFVARLERLETETVRVA
jgi:pimeloyl-ACP methyl ester carboxylesterase